MKNQKQAYIYALCTVAMWSTIATAFKLTLVYLSPFQLLFIAACTSTLLLTIFVAKQGKLHFVPQYLRQRPLLYLALGTLNPFLYYSMLLKGYDLLPAQQAQPLSYTWAIALTLLAVPFLGQKLRKRDGVAILLGYLGAMVIATKGDLLALQFDSSTGVLLVACSTLAWASYWILNTRNQGDPIVSLLVGFLISLPLIGIATAIFSDFNFSAWQGIAGGIYVGCFDMGFAFILWLKAMRAATHTASISNLIFISPFVSLVLLSVIVGEDIHPATLVGLVLIVSALLVQQLKYGKRYRQPQVEAK